MRLRPGRRRDPGEQSCRAEPPSRGAAELPDSAGFRNGDDVDRRRLDLDQFGCLGFSVTLHLSENWERRNALIAGLGSCPAAFTPRTSKV
jgi:hypothetical protein